VARLDWGHPRTAAALADHVSGGRIRRAFDKEMLGAAQPGKLDTVVEHTEGDAGALALVAAAGGALWLALRRGRRAAFAILAVIVAGDLLYALFLNPMGIVERQTGTPLLVGVALLAGVGVAAGARAAGRLSPVAAGALAIMVALAPLASGATDKLAARQSDAARAWAEAALAATPPRGVAFLREDSTISALFWLTMVEPLRPDVAALARQHLWDVERTAAVLGSKVAPGERAAIERRLLEGDRPVVWEIGNDASMPVAPGVPVGYVGRLQASGAKAPIADVEKIFAPPAAGDGLARQTIARAFHNAGVMRARAGDLRRGAELVEKSIAIDPLPMAHLNAARYRLALGDEDAARAHAVAAVRAQPDRASVWSLIGTLDARAGRCAEAARHLDRALELDPNDPDARINRPKLAGCVEKRD